MTVLNTTELLELAQRHGAEPELTRIMAAAALTEAPAHDNTGQVVGADTDAVGDNGTSIGLFQINDIHGLSQAQRFDPEFATQWMLDHEYKAALAEGRARGSQGEQLARWTYMRAERPRGWMGPDAPGLDSAAANSFAARWGGLPGAAPSSDNAAGEALISAGRAFLGTPYGLPPGPNQFDCSLFVLRAAAKAGYPALPASVRTAQQIGDARQSITGVDAPGGWDNSRVQRGDLLLFEKTYEGNPGERATHIGIALLGGRMLDCNETHGVGETQLTGWWTDRLYAAVRWPLESTQIVADPRDGDISDLEQRLAVERSYSSALLVNCIRPALAALRQSPSDVTTAIAALVQAEEQPV